MNTFVSISVLYTFQFFLHRVSSTVKAFSYRPRSDNLKDKY